MSTELRNGENCDSYNLKGFSKTLKNNNNNKPTSWWSRYLTAISGAVLKGDNLFTPTALWIQKPTCKHLIWITFVFAPTDSQLQISKIQSSCLSGISWQICKYSVKASAWPRTDLSSVLKPPWKDCFFSSPRNEVRRFVKSVRTMTKFPIQGSPWQLAQEQHWTSQHLRSICMTVRCSKHSWMISLYGLQNLASDAFQESYLAK